MSDYGKAIFLSYASQDAEAAQRIAGALRAAGVEVWFDQNELAGGDAWDAKIRRQIKDCALFVPVISANTNARAEGYFRLEWKLAVDRSHLMADDAAFLFPIVIGDLADATARVPDKFRDVQWTRLRLDETPAELAARVAKLLSGFSLDAGRSLSAEVGRHSPGRVSGMRGFQWWMILPVIGTIMGLMFAAVPLWKVMRGPAPKRVAAAVAAPTELQKLLTQARVVVMNDQLDELPREDLLLAESLLQRAVQLDPSNGEAWALLALCSCEQIAVRFDTTQSRKAAARDQAARALRLAPDSNEARFAWALSYRFQNTADAAEAIRLHRELAAREPANKFILRQLGRALESSGDPANVEEALTCYQRAAALPGGDALALRLQADCLFQLGRSEEILPLLDRALELRPGAGHLYADKTWILLALRADLGAARAVLARMPPAFLLDDLGASAATDVWMWSREPDKALAVLAGLSHDDMDCRWFTGPKAIRTGDAHQLAGRLEAARADWRIALQRVGQKLAQEPGAARWLGYRALLLAKLGERETAEGALRIYEQVQRLPAGQIAPESWGTYLALGRLDEVMNYLEGNIADRRAAVEWLGILRHAPELDPLRRHPRFAPLLKRTEALFAGGTVPVAGPGVREKSVAVSAK